MHIADIEVFTAIGEGGSLSAVARRIGLTPMAVSRRLASLERELGVRLVHRTTRSVSLTPEGDTFLPYALTLVQASESAKTALKTHPGCASGILRLTAPTVFGQSVIMPLIPKLLEGHPALKVDMTLSDSIVDIAGLGIDLAIRIATMRDSNLVARPLAPNPRVLCASPAYLQKRGLPTALNELSGHQRIILHSMPYWPFMRDGAPVSIRGEGTFYANNVETVRLACKKGLGLAMLTYWDVREDLATGDLQQVELEDVSQEQLFITAVLPSRQHIPHRVRVFLDRLEAALLTAT